MRKLIADLENNQPMPNISWESISEISKAWNYDVTHRTIQKSFVKAGFLLSSESSASTEEEENTPLVKM
ncbi:tigger transposable element-derived protein 4 [Trichonephila clavipes]|uniref:Tigger transposable element-derived protein 4 n=1 Tax=Trichonephila clavipes TaxID=2585209 RepID=A0A8X6VTX4_TRICX|nr:tigger transposable element-derived protein 4 [Trichonephila clavipes]